MIDVARVLITGTEELREVAARLRDAGDRKLITALARGIKNAAKPAVDELKQKVRGLPVEGERGATLSGGALARMQHDVLRSRSKNIAHVIKRAIGRAGLRDTIARIITTQVSTSARRAAVRIRIPAAAMPPKQRRLPRYLNKGKWRHPVFGNKEVWVGQKSEPHWFEDTLKKQGPEVRKEILAQVRQVTDKI